MEKILVTGATGFVGKYLIRKLAEVGHEICAIIRNGSLNLELDQLENINIVHCNLENMKKLPDLISDKKWDVFYHLAWEGVANEKAADVDTQLNNVKYACDAVRAASELGCNKFVFASSIMEFEVAKLMSTEINAGVRNIYSTAKIAGNYMARIVANDLNIQYNSAIVSNIYGPEEFSDRFVITTLRNMVLNKPMQFSVATQNYDFIYIKDACELLYRIGLKGINNKRYYVGSGNICPLREFICKMRDIVNPNFMLSFGQRDYVGVSLDYKEFDTSSWISDLGYSPETTFEDGIRATVNWIKRYQEINNEKN